MPTTGVMVPSRLIGCLALLAAALVPAVAAAAAAGSVTLVRAAGTSGDAAWARAHIWRMHGATPWDVNSWVRRSAYALDAATATTHPEWVLKDAFGNRVYLGSSFAADFGNPAYRAWWIGQAGAQSAGLRGLYVDDVSMERRVYTAAGYLTRARDPRTGATLSEANWQRYMADFMVELRTALPAAEIVHDVLWHKGDTRANIVRELGAADVLALEEGFNDAAVLTYGWEMLAGWIERRQAAGRRVILDGAAESPAARVYGLGTSLLLDTGGIALGNDGWTAPDRYWSGYDVKLGAPASSRTWWNNVWRRDFAQGIVLVNPAGAPTRTVAVGSGFADLDGVVRTDVILPAASAAVLVRVPAPPPTPTPTPVTTPEPVVAVPVATPTPAPRRPVSRVSAHIAGAAQPKQTRTTVTLSRLSVSGKVSGAVSGSVRVHVQRKRGKGWLTVRRVKPSVSRRGTFRGAIARLSRGTYRVLANFEGTGTALPSRAEPKLRSL